jgi:pentapeptide MXKDX repeat protein
MNKKVTIIIAIIASLLVIGGGTLAYTNDQNNKKEAETVAMEKDAMEKDAMEKDAMEKDAMEKDAMEKDGAMSKSGSYVTLADYNSDTSKFEDSKKVYFFHASWCPICQGIDKDINSDPTRIPAGITVIKTDFDNSRDLRQKYGVTTQYTFVQVDSNGNETAQWSATNLDKAIAGIES